jgi:hypothetical protein
LLTRLGPPSGGCQPQLIGKIEEGSATQTSSRQVRRAPNAVGARSRDHRAERSSVLKIAALAFGTCCASAAQAKVNFCNQYDVPVFDSVAYNENGEWVSKGCEKVEPAVIAMRLGVARASVYRALAEA